MSNLQQHFLPYELSNEFKELGFKDDCLGYYDSSQKVQVLVIGTCNNYEVEVNGDENDHSVAAPLISQARQFLREKHSLYVETIVNDGPKFDLQVNEISGGFLVSRFMRGWVYDSYEQAQLAGIKHAIELIKIKKRAEHTMKLKDVR